MSQEISIDVEGKKYTGRVEVNRGIVTVSSAYRIKSTQVGGSPATVIARLLLGEISRDFLKGNEHAPRK